MLCMGRVFPGSPRSRGAVCMYVCRHCRLCMSAVVNYPIPRSRMDEPTVKHARAFRLGFFLCTRHERVLIDFFKNFLFSFFLKPCFSSPISSQLLYSTQSHVCLWKGDESGFTISPRVSNNHLRLVRCIHTYTYILYST